MGRIIKNESNALTFDAETKEKLNQFIRGECTWAEFEGMTFEEARAIAQIGCDLAAAGRLEEARIIFEGLVAGNSRDSGARAALGTVYQKLGRLEDAIAEYNGAIEVDPCNPVALANRGELRLRSGDRDGFADLALAVKADPDGESTAGRRAKALIKAITMKAVDMARGQAETGRTQGHA